MTQRTYDDRPYKQVLEDAAAAYAQAVRQAKTPSDHIAAAQTIGDNFDIWPEHQGLVLAAGLSMVVKPPEG